MHDIEQKLELIAKARDYCIDVYGIDMKSIFKRYTPNRSEPVYCVYVCAKDRLANITDNITSSYQFNNQFKAKDTIELYNKYGYDSYLFRSEAYAAENCPISTSMINLNREKFISSVFHEGFHLDSEKKDRGYDIFLEEALATNFGEYAAIEFFMNHNKPDLVERTETMHQDWGKFSDLIYGSYKTLEELYEEDTQAGRDHLEVVAQDFMDLKKEIESPIIKKRCQGPINNAFLIRYMDYAKHYRLVESSLSTFSMKEYLDNQDEIDVSISNKIE